MTTLSRPETIKHLAAQAETIAALLAAFDVLPAADRECALATCAGMTENLSSDLFTLTKGGA